MKIVEIIPTLISGGAERFVVDLSNALAKHPGIEVIILSLYDKNEQTFLFDEIANNIRIKTLGKHGGFDCRIIFKVLSFLKKESPDIVHTHIGAFPYVFFSFPFIKANFFHTVHNDAYKEASGIDLMMKKIAYRLHLCTPITISKESYNSFVKLYGRKEVSIIYNGCTPADGDTINLSRYKKTPNTKIIVNVARIFRQKNQISLAKSATRLISEGKDIVVLFVGRIEDETIFARLKALFSDRILYLGEVRNPRAIMASADFFCLPSVYEGMPITLLEAFSVGCVPVCSPVGGNKDVISSGVNGILGNGYDDESVFQMLNRALELSEDEYRAMRIAAIKSFDLYSIQSCASHYLQLFAKK